MKIFITGIAGFIGFHLARYLKGRGDEVLGCDNFNDYYDPRLKRERAKILAELRIPILEKDICDASFLEKIVAEEKLTHFVHLAAQAGVRYSLKNPGPYVSTNLDGFVKVLEALKKSPSIKLIYASSSSVYGLNKKIPFSETDVTDLPANLYGATKKANELLAQAYHHLYRISATGLRFFTVYGPWGRPDMAYFSFTEAILAGKPIEIYGEGKLKRDFTYIDDVVKGTAAAIDLGAPCEIFNLGNNRPEEVLTLVSLIEKGTGKQAIKAFLPLQSGDVPLTYADISKSQKLLGYRPTTTLEEGIRHFLEWRMKSAQNRW